MTDTQFGIITSPSGVEVQKLAIQNAFNGIVQELQVSNNTNLAANVLATGRNTASAGAVTLSSASSASASDSAAVDQRPTKKQRTEHNEALDGFLGGADNKWALWRGDDRSPSATVPYTPPQETLTGVNPELLKVCATLCHQMYYVKAQGDFKLPYDARVLFYTDHGIFTDTVPPFAIASHGNSLILAWRGSMSVVDWTSNLAYAPVSSSRLSTIAPNLRLHSSYNSIVESDLALYHNEIMNAINQDDQDITQIIFTGHSLGGGLANVAHIILKSELEQDQTQWKTRRPEGLTCRTVAFSAPMTTLNLESNHSGTFDPTTPTNKFLKKVSDNTCNIIYSFDPVPHAVADLAFLAGTMKNLLPDLTGNNLFTGALLGIFGVESQIQGLLNKLYALADYHHIGKLIYYKHDAAPQPVVLRDSNFLDDSSASQFRGNQAIPTAPRRRGSVKDVVAAHMFFPEAFVDQAYRQVDKKG